MTEEEFLRRHERLTDRLERLMETNKQLALYLNAQIDDTTNLTYQLQEERRRFATIADVLSRKLFEKAIHEWVDEERERQRRMRNPRTTGGFQPGKTA